MTGRGFCVKIELDLHAVTCPGVWLCPNGKTAIRMSCFESYLESKKVDPVFPLLFHNKFVFEKLFTGVNTLVDLQHCLESEHFCAELLQWSTRKSDGLVLAIFHTSLAEILYPAPCFKGALSGIDVDLLMQTQKSFPGIIAPKIEISTKTAVEEVIGEFDRHSSSIRTLNPKIISSKSHSCGQKGNQKKNIRQRRVCHSQGISLPSCARTVMYRPTDYTTDNCYHVIGTKLKLSPSAEKFDAKRANCPNQKECSVCTRYRHYFSDFHIEDQSSNCHEHPCTLRTTYKSPAYVDTSDSSLSHLDDSFCLSRSTNTCKESISTDAPKGDNTQDFYKNLEQFYKRMYKHAKLRAQQSHSCT